jgi:hypothetical protein
MIQPDQPDPRGRGGSEGLTFVDFPEAPAG